MPLTASVERVFYFSARVLKSLFKAAFGPATVDEGKERLTERVRWKKGEGKRERRIEARGVLLRFPFRPNRRNGQTGSGVTKK